MTQPCRPSLALSLPPPSCAPPTASLAPSPRVPSPGVWRAGVTGRKIILRQGFPTWIPSCPGESENSTHRSAGRVRTLSDPWSSLRSSCELPLEPPCLTGLELPYHSTTLLWAPFLKTNKQTLRLGYLKPVPLPNLGWLLSTGILQQPKCPPGDPGFSIRPSQVVLSVGSGAGVGGGPLHSLGQSPARMLFALVSRGFHLGLALKTAKSE